MEQLEPTPYNIAKLVAKVEQLEKSHRYFSDLMAIIHGDGGHYQAMHGDEKATIDAIHIINNCIKEIDNLKYELKTLKSQIKGN